jgi:TPR repeat protein
MAPSSSEPVAEAAPAAPSPVWQPERKAAQRKVPAPRRPVASNALALRNTGYAELLQRRYPQAFSLLQQATVMGDAYAPMYIGQLFANGLGVPRDIGQASYWYGIAINRGNAAALSAFNRLRLNPY